MPSLALSQQHSVARPQTLVRELDGAAAQFDDPRAHDDLVVVSGGGAVLHAGLGNRQKRVSLRFHVAVIEPVIAAEFDPPDLEPDQIIRVINDSGLIGLGVTDAQPRLAPLVVFRIHYFRSLDQIQDSADVYPESAVCVKADARILVDRGHQHRTRNDFNQFSCSWQFYERRIDMNPSLGPPRSADP